MIGWWRWRWKIHPNTENADRELTVFFPTRDGWIFGLGMRFEGHRSEGQIALQLLVVEVNLWWYR